MRRVFLAGVLSLVTATAWAQPGTDFRWNGSVAPGKTIEIKGVSGAIHAELATGGQVEVVATKRARRSDPASVRVEVVQENGNVTICAVYPTPTGWFGAGGSSQPNECRPGSEGRMNSRDNDVQVEFTVRVPEGVRLAARTVNGAVDVKPIKSDVLVRTVNGRVTVATSRSADVNTVNGAIDASMGTVSAAGPLALKTVNGTVTVRLPKDVNAELRASTVNGHVESDLPLLMRNISSRNRHVDGTLGSGGGELRLETVNGSIFLRLITGI